MRATRSRSRSSESCSSNLLRSETLMTGLLHFEFSRARLWPFANTGNIALLERRRFAICLLVFLLPTARAVGQIPTAGLYAWYNASNGVTTDSNGVVQSWTDASGN